MAHIILLLIEISEFLKAMSEVESNSGSIQSIPPSDDLKQECNDPQRGDIELDPQLDPQGELDYEELLEEGDTAEEANQVRTEA